jgi:5,5'-dehydrodivanillate O-demethylase
VVTTEENELLTRIGPGTRMGALMRRYWQPIGTAGEMQNAWTKRIRILDEDLVLFRDRANALGLIAEKCPHRNASMAYGIPAADGIRCPYHGWKFNAEGRCIDQPNEAPGSTFAAKTKTTAYPVEELGGLLWAYMGPLPAPAVPKLDGLVAEGTIRILGSAVIPCNWLQIMENSLDAVHTEWLHGHFFEFVKEADGLKVSFTQKHEKIGFDEFEYGIVKRRVLAGHTEADDDWKIGHPVIFPNVLAIGNASPNWHEYRFQFRVPIDDTHTRHYWFGAFVLPNGARAPQHLLDRVHEYDTPIFQANGDFMLDSIHGQDIMAWCTQGPIADRSRESLGSTDKGITTYRKMLLRELKRMEEGHDPKNVIRDPNHHTIVLPLEGKKAQRADGFEALFRRHQVRYSPIADEILDVLRAARGPELVAT